jgi:Family of unknown function (DUF6152)
MQTRLIWVASMLVWALGVAVPVHAHHSVAGVFDVNKTVTLSGTVSRVEWINPHTYIYVDVKDPGGAVTTWKLEVLPVAMMRKAGISMQMLMSSGQHVQVEANPARNGAAAFGFALKLTYDDGRTYQFGRSPDDKPVLVQ